MLKPAQTGAFFDPGIKNLKKCLTSRCDYDIIVKHQHKGYRGMEQLGSSSGS